MTAGHDHPDRAAATLANRGHGFAPTPPDAPRGDARVTLHQLWHAVDVALAQRHVDAAHDWLRDLDTADLRAGTVQDGVALGVEARLTEALSLCAAPPEMDDAVEGDEITGKDLRRRREILVASGGSRVRFSRKNGVHMIDRASDRNEPHFVQFDDQEDVGCLDEFTAAPNTRARIFQASFLKPVRLVEGKDATLLELAGRLGRGPHGFDCRLTLRGDKSVDTLRLRVRIDNRQENHRLRIRFAGLSDATFVQHRGTPGFSTITSGTRQFIAATIVRACGRLRVGDNWIATPHAQMQGPIEHVFEFGSS